MACHPSPGDYHQSTGGVGGEGGRERTQGQLIVISSYTLSGRIGKVLKVARLRDRIPAVAELHRFILCMRRSGGAAHEGGSATSQLDLPSLTPLSIVVVVDCN